MLTVVELEKFVKIAANVPSVANIGHVRPAPLNSDDVTSPVPVLGAIFHHGAERMKDARCASV
jgi:hypothetical protein